MVEEIFKKKVNIINSFRAIVRSLASDSKYPKYYPIPPELEPFIDSYYLTHEYFNKDLYNKHHNLEEEKEINPWTK